MRQKRAMGLSLVLAGTILAGGARAQVKFASFDAPDEAPKHKGIVFQQAKERADVKHGTFMSLTLNDGRKVTGNVVRYDSKNKKLYLRTQAGEAPMAFTEADLKQMDKAAREVDADGITSVSTGDSEWRDLPGSRGLQENANGTIRIRPAGGDIKPAAARRDDTNKIKPLVDNSNLKIQNIVEPEITKQVIYNGSQRTVIYLSSTVSPGEREILDQIQKAENDLMALAAQRDLRDLAIVQEMAMMEERLKNQRLINITMQNENQVNYPHPPILETETLVPGPHMLTTRLITMRQANKGVTTLLPQAMPPAIGLIDRLPPIDAQAYAKARDEYTQLLRAHAIFEDGRLAAVVASK